VKRYITVTLVSTTETSDDYGNTTPTTSSKSYDQVRFSPRASSERSDVQSPAVITAASLYRRGEFPVMPPDAIMIANQHPHIDGTWQVDGEVGQWASGVEVAIQRVGAQG
jgi:hypothetical protein